MMINSLSYFVSRTNSQQPHGHPGTHAAWLCPALGCRIRGWSGHFVSSCPVTAHHHWSDTGMVGKPSCTTGMNISPSSSVRWSQEWGLDHLWEEEQTLNKLCFLHYNLMLLNGTRTKAKEMLLLWKPKRCCSCMHYIIYLYFIHAGI